MNSQASLTGCREKRGLHRHKSSTSMRTFFFQMDLFTSIGPLWRFSETEHRWCRSHPPPASASPPLRAPSLFATAMTSWEDQSSVWTNHRAGWHQRSHEYIRHPSPYSTYMYIKIYERDLFYFINISKHIGMFFIRMMPLSFYCAVVTQNFQIQVVF